MQTHTATCAVRPAHEVRLMHRAGTDPEEAGAGEADDGGGRGSGAAQQEAGQAADADGLAATQVGVLASTRHARDCFRALHPTALSTPCACVRQWNKASPPLGQGLPHLKYLAALWRQVLLSALHAVRSTDNATYSLHV